MTENIERRYFQGIELRESPKGSNSPGTLAGYAAVFNTLSGDLGYFREIINPGAFTETLKTADVRALDSHLQFATSVIGRSSAGTLRLSEDAKGLRVEIDLPDTTAGRDLAVSVSRGDVDGMSFGFLCEDSNGDSWDLRAPVAIRTLIKIALVEVSVVAWQAYADATVAKRSLDLARSKTETRQAEPTPDITPEAPDTETPPTPDTEPEPAPATDPAEAPGLDVRSAYLRLAELL